MEIKNDITKEMPTVDCFRERIRQYRQYRYGFVQTKVLIVLLKAVKKFGDLF